jgi:hypothetical protein
VVDAASLLSVLVLGGESERASVLHRAVMLRRADGTTHNGRASVLESFARAAPGTRYQIAARETASRLRVELRVPDVPGYIEFTVAGELEDDLLILVVVEA